MGAIFEVFTILGNSPLNIVLWQTISYILSFPIMVCKSISESCSSLPKTTAIDDKPKKRPAQAKNSALHEPTFQPMQGAAFIFVFYLLYKNNRTEFLFYLKIYQKECSYKSIALPHNNSAPAEQTTGALRFRSPCGRHVFCFGDCTSLQQPLGRFLWPMQKLPPWPAWNT